MATKNITLGGFILNRKKKGIANMKVEAWDKEMIVDDFVGSAVTDSKGRFVITFTRKYFNELFLDRKPDLFFKVYHKDKLVKSTEETVLWNLEKNKTDIEIFIDLGINKPDTDTLEKEIRREKAAKYAKIIGLKGAKFNQLVDKDLNFENISETTLNDLVKEKLLTIPQREDLLVTSKLSLLCGENFELIKAIKTDSIKSHLDFIGWEKRDWQQVIIDNKIPVPRGQTPESYADNIFFNLDQTYPSRFFFDRLFKLQNSEKLYLVDSLHNLLVNNNKLIDNGKPARIDWENTNEENKKKLQKDLSDLTSFANTFKRLGVIDLINDKKLDSVRKKDTINSRLQSLDTFNKNNLDLDLRFVNFFDNKREIIDWMGIPEQDIHLVRKQLMAYQRVLNLAENTADRQMLLSKGYDSAVAISSESSRNFVANSGIEESSAKVIFAKAQANSVSVTNSFENIRDIVRGQFKNLAVSNLSPQLVNDLREIDGFEDLFNSQDYCDCEECKSILSPSAYFVDLMRFINEHVSKPFFKDPVSNLEDHPLYLKNRRADLWNQKLTCEATNTLIPYLSIVNEVLEEYLGSDIYNTLSKKETKISFSLPFNLFSEELQIYLSHFNLSPHEIYKKLRLEETKIWQAKLNISQEEFEVITCEDSGNVIQRVGNPTSLTEFPVQDYKDPQTNSLRRGFINLLGITREQLDELLAIRNNPDLSKIGIVKQKEPDELQNFPEFLDNLIDERLDFIHRFIRLWKRTPWSIPELDMLLAALAKSYSIPSEANVVITYEINSQIVIDIARMIRIQENLKFSIEELCAMVDQLPVSVNYPALPENVKDKKLFERLFDTSKLFGENSNSCEFYCYLMAKPNTVSIDDKTPLLLAGLGISETELYSLFRLLENKIIFDANGKCMLNREVISILYRHAKIAKALRINIEDLISMLSLNFDSNNLNISTPDKILQLVEFQEWLNASPFSLALLNFILKGEERNPANYVINLDIVETIVKEIQNDNEVEKVVALKTRLLKLYNISPVLLEYILKWVNTSIGDIDVKTALEAKFNNEGKLENEDDLKGLLKFLKETECILSLFSFLKLKEETIAFISENYEVLGFSNLKALSLDNLKDLALFKTLITIHDQAEPLVENILINYHKENSFLSDTAKLADLWQQDKNLIESITQSVNFTSVPIEAMAKIGDYLDLCKTLGINGYSLQKFADDTQLQETRNIVVGAFKSKYDDEKVREDKLEPYEDKINTLKRDALCDFIIAHEMDFKFKDRNDVYAFFLLDVEMSGCFRISRIVAAISSLQLYIHRCLLNLEQSGDQNQSIPDVKVKPDEDFINEWEWRKNFRVWEANRKVFLYPENYLEPDLRDNKTPIFKELEDELLQQKITKESAEVAYKKYVSQFSELAHLRIVGSYYHQKEEDSFYYFFGRTHIEPYQYYYRKYYPEQALWCPWIKIELAIDAAEVSAIINLGKLYLFWTEVQRKELSGVHEGNSTDVEYQFKVFVKYSYLNENGKWVTPQRIYLNSFKLAKEQIGRRILHSSVVNDEVLEDTISKYEKKVFRKPFPIESDWPSNQISLGYIWSNLQYWNYDDFKSIITKRLNIPWNKQVNAIIEPITFDAIINNIYNFQPQPFILKLNTEEITGTAYLFGIETCICDIDSIPNFGIISLGIDRYTQNYRSNTDIVELSVDAAIFKLMLHKNKIDEAATVTGKIDDSGLSFLKKEFNLSFVDNKIEQSFVQDGTATFSENGRIIHQMASNENYLQTPSQGGGIKLTKLSTSFTDELNAILNTLGIDGFLNIKTQQLFTSFQALDFHGPYGEYYWEIFFHIPFLIASHLNANQKYQEANYWFEKIFNPMATDKQESNIKTDRNWRYIEFRGQHIQKMKEILTDKAAVEKYKTDPFNPHAIARLRLNAYMKTIVMKYIDNLLDWGDYLFTLDTMESINEATMLYILAADILGKRPIKLGKCEIAKNVTYQTLELCIENDEGSEFLYMVENWWWSNLQYQLWGKDQEALTEKLSRNKNVAAANKLSEISLSLKNGEYIENLKGDIFNLEDPRVPSINHYNKVLKERNKNNEKIRNIIESEYSFRKTFPGLEIVRQALLMFCVPPNKFLLQFWDRVEDRLFKIRHCMNISGVRRQLALFQPPIEPMLLVRAKAAGLSLEDITGIGKLQTPYRFSYLVEKARQYTQTLQSFGAALLSALEKKDVEELTLLRSVHERNILRMTRDIKMNSVKETAHQLQALEESMTNVQNRIEYYDDLIKGALTGWEITQQISRHIATIYKTEESIYHLGASIAFLVPQTGSPFSMNYGGRELGENLNSMAGIYNSMYSIAEAISGSAGLEAGFQRREQEWNQQLRLAKQELKQVEQQRLAAEIRQLIAEKDLEIHDTNIDQADEIYEFYKNKFTNLGLYNYLSTSLNRLYGESYKIAYELANMAQNAYRFEKDDETFFIAGDNWQYDRAGLLAGERLLLQLQKMEREYLVQNTRDYELTKHVSLSLLDPLALVKLRTLGECNFKIPEILYDMDFPGQYLRKIKSVSISMPCIAGPYTSVSAKLSITDNRYRKSMDVTNGYIEIENDDRFVYFPNAYQSSIATSTAQNDSGIFELNFRDERYLPFEGSGAISNWSLELPTKVRQFDYNTIADVVIHVKYTAKEGGSDLKIEANKSINTRLTEIEQELFQKGLHIAINMKHDLSNEWNLLTKNGSVELKIDKSRLPYMAQHLNAKIDSIIFIVKNSMNSPLIKIDTNPTETKLHPNDIVSIGFSLIIGWSGMWQGDKNVVVALDTPFKIITDTLEELIMVVKYSF
jgi:hypothetical protein